MKEITVINSGGANLSSIKFALERLGRKIILTTDKETIKNSEKLILPGVGNAKYTMKLLNDLDLVNVIKNLTQPILGICLGMQLLFNYSEESDTNCLGIINQNVIKLPQAQNFPIPHMGWNSLVINNSSPLLEGIKNGDFCYFVHSYYVPKGANTLAYCEYSDKISAVIQKDNFFGCQFHPEKSSDVGSKILRNFLEAI
ncbi:MAG: imidazole glycerol phosphate synthase subunit HisH [Candidatus Gastranaerophilales bacterium]|nr:imidazole glycerol phosphate synthase subunit HisH [Candidatus Gastranaerophilales bacterium]